MKHAATNSLPVTIQVIITRMGLRDHYRHLGALGALQQKRDSAKGFPPPGLDTNNVKKRQKKNYQLKYNTIAIS
jgi:hypothetical protein